MGRGKFLIDGEVVMTLTGVGGGDVTTHGVKLADGMYVAGVPEYCRVTEYPNVTSREQADRIARQRMSIDATYTATVDPTERMIAMIAMNVTGMVYIDGAWSIETNDGCIALASWLSDPTPQPSVSPDLVDRMVQLVRDMHDDPNGTRATYGARIRDIAALLPPEPVDPLLKRARELAAPFIDGERQDVLDGKYDNHAAVYGALAALRDVS